MNERPETIPEFVELLGYKIPVVVEELEDLHGCFESSPLTIRIDETTPEPEKTLLHEMMHAILYVSGWSAKLDSETVEEGLAVCFENSLWPYFERMFKCKLES